MLTSFKKFLFKWYPLISILILAAALRINHFFHQGTLWFDETYSVHFSSISSWTDTLKYWVIETNPPFYHLFLRFYLPFIDKSNEFLLRLPSIIFAIISIALLYVFAQKIFSRHTAILSALFLALTPPHIKYSNEVRMYSLFVMVVMISFILYHKIIFEKKHTKVLWFFYTILTTIVLYTHLSGPAIIMIQLITILYLKIDKNLLKKWFLSQGIAVGLWSVWYIPSVISKFYSNIQGAWLIGDTTYMNFTIFNSLLMPFVEFKPHNYIFTTVATLLVLLAGYLLFKKFNISTPERKNYIFLVFVWAMLPIISSSLVGLFIAKYLLAAYLGLFILVAYIIDSYTADSQKKFQLALILVIILMSSLAVNQSNQTIADWRPVAKYIEKNETPNSITFGFFADAMSFREYYHGKQPVIDIYTREDDLPFYERIVRYNWNKQPTSKEDTKKWLFEKINENNADRVFIIYTSGLHHALHPMLQSEGWILKDIISSGGEYSYPVMEFEKPKNCNISME